MIRRTTIELDYDLVERAQTALNCPTVRATVHEALRRALDQAEDEVAQRKANLKYFFEHLEDHIDIEVLRSGEMWR